MDGWMVFFLLFIFFLYKRGVGKNFLSFFLFFLNLPKKKIISSEVIFLPKKSKIREIINKHYTFLTFHHFLKIIKNADFF